MVGKNYCFQVNSNLPIFVEDEINPFIGTGATPAAIDDFQGDNFDHGGLGFFGGGFLAPTVSGDPGARGAAGNAAVGLGLEGSDGAVV